MENEVNLNITKNIVVKAKLKIATNSLSQTFVQKFRHTLVDKMLYFKPLKTCFGSPCSYINWDDPQPTVEFLAPPKNMTEACEAC